MNTKYDDIATGVWLGAVGIVLAVLYPIFPEAVLGAVATLIIGFLIGHRAGSRERRRIPKS